jgi:hypothetical protein
MVWFLCVFIYNMYTQSSIPHMHVAFFYVIFFFARRFCMWVVCIYALYLYLYLEVHLTKRSTRLVPGRRECSHMTWRRNHRVRAHGRRSLGLGCRSRSRAAGLHQCRGAWAMGHRGDQQAAAHGCNTNGPVYWANVVQVANQLIWVEPNAWMEKKRWRLKNLLDMLTGVKFACVFL